MNLRIGDLLAPPVATHRRGAPPACTGPVAVFWIAALVAIAYGLMGGPLGDGGINWLLVFLGAFMWAAAAVWAELATRGDAGIQESTPGNNAPSPVEPEQYQRDPFDEIK